MDETADGDDDEINQGQSDSFRKYLHHASWAESRAESSVGSDARRELAIKAASNIYEPKHISWPHELLTKLVLANKIMSFSYCPCLFEGSTYISLPSGSLLSSLARNWGFSPSSISLGSVYFQRLVIAQKEGVIGQWIAISLDFKPYATIVKRLASSNHQSLQNQLKEKGELGLRSLFLCCLFLAAKVHGKIPPVQGFHQRAQSKIHGVQLTKQEVSRIEERCLKLLGWRLGPHFECLQQCACN